MNQQEIKLTQYSHGAGCGCKIAPKVLDKILSGNITLPDNSALIVGNHSKDDAAVLDLGNGTALISTTDFFMPIVDDPYQFGRIAAANAISDIYAMGGKPILAIAILGWPINTLAPEVAQKVVDGGKSICLEAGISLAGGHSIDSPEPIFGLAVNGIVELNAIKQNNTARPGDILLLTKPIGVGILTTAEKKGLLQKEHEGIAAKQMMQLNKIGEALGKIDGVHSMTDVTGFGLLGHLVEMTDGSSISAEISANTIPYITSDIKEYLEKGCVPGGTNRNWDSYGHRIEIQSNNPHTKNLLADPQTSGGLLISIDPTYYETVKKLFNEFDLNSQVKPIGKMVEKNEAAVYVYD